MQAKQIAIKLFFLYNDVGEMIFVQTQICSTQTLYALCCICRVQLMPCAANAVRNVLYML